MATTGSGDPAMPKPGAEDPDPDGPGDTVPLADPLPADLEVDAADPPDTNSGVDPVVASVADAGGLTSGGNPWLSGADRHMK